MLITLHFTLKFVLLVNSPVYICFQGISTSTFYDTREREVASVVLPPDGSSDSDEDEGTSEDEEDELGLRSLGTIRKNRLMGCTLEEDRDLLRRGRGSFDFHVDNDAKIAVVKWADNKTVTLVSSCASVNPVGQVRRYSKQEKKKISVPCPKIVSEYNTHIIA